MLDEFVASRLDSSAVTPKEEIRDSFNQYCREVTTVNDWKDVGVFGMALLKAGNGLITETRTGSDIRVQCYKGVKA